MVEHVIKGVDYFNIITAQLHPYIASIFPRRNGIVQQDNTACHKARIVLQWSKKHVDESQLMFRLPNSQDLNHPEHV